MKIIQPLTREFLQAHGVQFDGAFWVNPNCPFRLQATDVENTWMVTIPDLPIGQPQPEPISNYTDYLRLISAFAPNFVNQQRQGQNFLSKEIEIQFLTECIVRYFSFDKNLVFDMIITPMGAQLQPGNEYTHTLMSGNEAEFKAIYEYQSEDTVWESDFSIAPECVSAEYVLDRVASDENYDVNEMRLKMVLINANGNWIPFFGAGINFPKRDKAQ